MFKWLKDWLFATEDEQVKEVRVYDFIERRENGHDVTLRVIGDGDYAEAMVFLTLGDLPPNVGDFIVVDLEGAVTFVIDTVKEVSLGVSQLTLSRYEGEDDES